jgi:hypothetical protein
MRITAEIQKGHVYYRCTKKRGNCSQPYVREEKLDQQLSSMLQKFSLPEDWAEGLREMMSKDEKNAAQSSAAFVQDATKSAPYKPNSNDFSTAILNRTSSTKPTVNRRRFCCPKRSHWRNKWRGLNKSGLAGSNRWRNG